MMIKISKKIQLWEQKQNCDVVILKDGALLVKDTEFMLNYMARRSAVGSKKKVEAKREYCHTAKELNIHEQIY
jgi:hypothetical protein